MVLLENLKLATISSNLFVDESIQIYLFSFVFNNIALFSIISVKLWIVPMIVVYYNIVYFFETR